VYLDEDTDHWLHQLRRVHGYRSGSDAIRACLQFLARDPDVHVKLAEHEASLARERVARISQNARGIAAKPERMR